MSIIVDLIELQNLNNAIFISKPLELLSQQLSLLKKYYNSEDIFDQNEKNRLDFYIGRVTKYCKTQKNEFKSADLWQSTEDFTNCEKKFELYMELYNSIQYLRKKIKEERRISDIDKQYVDKCLSITNAHISNMQKYIEKHISRVI